MKIKVWVVLDMIVWPDEEEHSVTNVRVYATKEEADKQGSFYTYETELELGPGMSVSMKLW